MTRAPFARLALAPAFALWLGASALASAAPAPPAAAPAKRAPARRATQPLGQGPRRPLTLAAQTIEGRSEAPRVLFVHTGPKLALEDAPKHPSYLRDDFTAALSSPVTVRVRMLEPLRAATVPGGSR